MDPPTISKIVNAESIKRKRDEDSETLDAASRKRKRDEAVKQIIEEVEEIRDIRRELSPRSDNTATRLLALGRKILDDPDADVEPLSISHEAFMKGYEVAKERDMATSELDEIKFFLQISDWAANIVNNIRGMNDTARGKYAEHLGREYKKKGLGTYRDGQNEAKKSQDWTPFGTYSDGTWAKLSAEFDAVQKWRADGEPSGLEPATPVIDRLEQCCAHAKIEYGDFVKALKANVRRNELAHNPPPRLDNYLKPDGTVDWDSIWMACKDTKAKLKRSYDKGLLTESRYMLFRNTVDTWFKSYVSGWDSNGNAVETPAATKGKKGAIDRKAKDAKAMSAPMPLSSYKKGKWDGTVPRASGL
ncbi:hypothetical protein DL769_003602 [Monosporascus sp. CRB-8-3]|nr:hypothetical protein DL769_003602 [Monosporascus sp. CRB-8-3]